LFPLEHRTMKKAQNLRNPKCYTISSERFIISFRYFLLLFFPGLFRLSQFIWLVSERKILRSPWMVSLYLL
jgi:hypothetical protein